MKTKIHKNDDARQTLESFFANVIWIPNPKFQNFCRDKFKRYKENIVEVDWFGSGGGCYHLLFRLHSGHILAMHTDANVCEHSFEAWNSINDYYIDTFGECRGFGWEHESPNYHERCQAIA